MKTIEQVRQHLKELKELGKGFTPMSELFFNKDTKRLTIHGYVVANMMWEGLDGYESAAPIRNNTIYKEYRCNDTYIDQAMDLLDKQSDLCYFIDSPEGYGDGGEFVIRCFGDIKSFEKLLKLSNGNFLDCVKKMAKRKK